MADESGRKLTFLKIVLSEMIRSDCLNADVVLGLHELNRELREGRFTTKAKTRGEAILRTEALMQGLDDPRRLAGGWVDKDGSVSPNSEAGLRARLSDEIAFCLRSGGVRLVSGDTTPIKWTQILRLGC